MLIIPMQNSKSALRYAPGVFTSNINIILSLLISDGCSRASQ